VISVGSDGGWEASCGQVWQSATVAGSQPGMALDGQPAAVRELHQRQSRCTNHSFQPGTRPARCRCSRCQLQPPR
jgi:hypothetical protein